MTLDPTQMTPKIAVVTCLRDEGPFVLEWLAHLRALGVDRVLAFTNDCTDGTDAMLDLLAPWGVVHVAQGAVRDTDGPAPQWRALRAAWDHPALGGADWLAHLDCDEFLAVEGGDLRALLGDLDALSAEALALRWRLFGSAGRVEPGEGTVPARFTRAAPEGMVFPAQGSFIKTIFRRDGPFTGFGVHRPRQTRAPRMVDDRLRSVSALAEAQGRIIHFAEGARRVQLNHYSLKSAHEFLVKTQRGLPNRADRAVDLAYWVERNFDAVPCDRIAPQLPALDTALAKLRAVPGMAKLEADARDHHRARLDRVLATPEGVKLLGQLVLAGPSRAPDAKMGRALLAMYGAAQRKDEA